MTSSRASGQADRRTDRPALRNKRKNILCGWRFQPALECLEERCLLSGDFRSITGYGDNQGNPNWGKANSDLLRGAPAAYADGISKAGGADRPSARVVSNQIDRELQSQVTLNDRYLSDFVYLWGQFLDH